MKFCLVIFFSIFIHASILLEAGHPKSADNFEHEYDHGPSRKKFVIHELEGFINFADEIMEKSVSHTVIHILSDAKLQLIQLLNQAKSCDPYDFDQLENIFSQAKMLSNETRKKLLGRDLHQPGIDHSPLAPHSRSEQDEPENQHFP